MIPDCSATLLALRLTVHPRLYCRVWICKSLATSLTERLSKTKEISFSHVSTERREWKNKVPWVSPKKFLQSLQRYLYLPPLRPFLTTATDPHLGQTILSSATLDCLHFSNNSADLLWVFIVVDSLPKRACLSASGRASKFFFILL